jgi:hypothetical protein
MSQRCLDALDYCTTPAWSRSMHSTNSLCRLYLTTDGAHLRHLGDAVVATYVARVREICAASVLREKARARANHEGRKEK